MSVVIVTYNKPKDVTEAVESLSNQSVKPFEVIVIDDGSNPHQSIEFRIQNLKFIRFNQEVGLSNARNYGIKVAKGECIAFIDDDGLAERNWIEEIQKGLDSADVIGGSIKPLYQASPPEWWNEKDFGAKVGVCNVLSTGVKIWGCNMAFRTEVFRMIGLFNPNLGRRKGKLFSFEETDIINRARSKGFNAQFIPAAVVYHKVPPRRMTIGYIARWNYYLGRSLKLIEGFQPLKSFVDLLLVIAVMASPRKIFAEKPTRIKNIGRMAYYLGRLF